MSEVKRYKKNANQSVLALQINLNLGGGCFHYEKWGGWQTCKMGDWLVNNNGGVYTVDKETFAKTYTETSSGRYAKLVPVWAIKAPTNGNINTKEGVSHYNKGDYIVYNNEDKTDGYCMNADKFESMYKLDE